MPRREDIVAPAPMATAPTMELRNLEEIVALAKRLRRANPKTGERLSFRQISARLAEAGHRNERGLPFNPQSVRAMIEGPQTRERGKL